MPKEHAMVTTGLIVQLEAKPGKEEELAAFLVDALALVENEPQTVAWFALRASSRAFAIVDVFPGEEGRRAHLEGPVAAALSERAEELLARPPAIERVEALAGKLPPTQGAS
jgi:quinol monooxygenase YgiN